MYRHNGACKRVVKTSPTDPRIRSVIRRPVRFVFASQRPADAEHSVTMEDRGFMIVTVGNAHGAGKQRYV